VAWTTQRAKDLDDPPEWLIAEEARQKAFIKELRRKRLEGARALLNGFVGVYFSGAGPWRFDDAYSAWRESSGQLPDWNFAYKSRWFLVALTGHGLRITGRRRTPRIRYRDAYGLIGYRPGWRIDERLIEREAAVG
jgi:hypothetical protein